MKEMCDAITNPDDYFLLPPRHIDEPDKDYLLRVKAFTQGWRSGEQSMYVMFDRLIDAMESETFKIPNGLSREEKRNFILNSVIKGDI